MLEKADSWQDATALLLKELNIPRGGIKRVKLPGDLGEVALWEELMAHVTEKREDGRERYARYIMPTLATPDEVWETKYNDGTTRRRFIRVFEGSKNGLTLIVHQAADGSVLWNVMHRKPKDMNDWRIGVRVYPKMEKKREQ